MLYLFVFLAALVFNLYVIIWDGKKDLQKLKEKISIGKYLSELNTSINELFGEYSKYFKTVVIGLLAIMVIVNAMFFLGLILSIALGTYAAKKSYQVPVTSNLINKLATYINRYR